MVQTASADYEPRSQPPSCGIIGSGGYTLQSQPIIHRAWLPSTIGFVVRCSCRCRASVPPLHQPTLRVIARELPWLRCTPRGPATARFLRRGRNPAGGNASSGGSDAGARICSIAAVRRPRRRRSAQSELGRRLRWRSLRRRAACCPSRSRRRRPVRSAPGPCPAPRSRTR